MTQETKANQGKGAIFDLDGTLLDSMGVWDQVDVDFLAKRGIEVPDDYMQKVAAMQFRQIAEKPAIASVVHKFTRRPTITVRRFQNVFIHLSIHKTALFCNTERAFSPDSILFFQNSQLYRIWVLT